MAELMALDEALRELVHDGDSMALEGVTHLIPFARIHPGVSMERVWAETGWNLRVAGDLGETEPPSDDELCVLRGLKSALAEATA